MAFVTAKREQVWLKILISGPSGAGKSYSALRVATGLAKKCNSRIAYIGTEGSRDKYYADDFEYDLDQLEAPYSIDKYMNSINDAISAGYKVLIIDSISHEWQWLNDTHDKMPGNSFQNWGKLKPKHKTFMDSILHSPIHVIACARGKTEWLLEDKNGKQVPKKVGMGQVQDKDISYDYTVSFMLDQDTHIASSDKDNTKIYDQRYEVLTEKDGEMLYEWANKSDIPATVKKMPTETNQDSDDDLKSIRSEIVTLAKELAANDKDTVMATIKKYVSSGNPNGIKDISMAQQLLDDLKALA